jgi:pSer/pThr/pTyr-binding forkhead associated (FHA) protein
MNGMPVIRVQLVHIQGPLKGQIQEFTQTSIIVGRHPSCSVQFPTETTTISRRHAEFVRVDNRYKVVDLSTNGTFVNGKRVTEAFLKDGDVVMFTEGGPKVSFLATITDEIMPAEEPPAPEVKPAPVPEPEAPVPRPAPEAKPAPQLSEPVSQPAPAPKPEPEVKPAPRVEEPVSRPAPKPVVETPHAKPVEAAPRPSQPQRQNVLKVPVPLIVQYGPQLHSYKELPVTIGKRSDCDFVLAHPALADQHAQIFFAQNQYWVRDLTGGGSITVNGSPIGFESPLKAQDVLRLAPQGPAFSFLGEGRLAEHEEAEEEAPVQNPEPATKAEEKKGRSFIRDLFKK